MDVEERNYCFLVVLLCRVGQVKLRDYFIKEWNSVTGFNPWTDCTQNGTDLLTIYTPRSYDLDKVTSGDTKAWDLSLLISVLFYSRPPFVPKSKQPLFDSLNKLRQTRITLCHSGDAKIKSSEFNKLYSDVYYALTLLGALHADFQKAEDDIHEPNWSQVLSRVKECASQDKKILKRINTINKRIVQMQKTLQNLLKGQGKILKKIKVQNTPSTSKWSDVETYSISLKEVIKKKTDILPRGIDVNQPSLKTDEIFTKLIVYQNEQKSLQQEDQLAHSSGKTVTECSKIFVAENKKERNPKSILVSGDPGIGKTLFLHKILRDWSTNCLKIPDIQVTCLITFRQLAQLGDSELTLQELLNLSLLLDDNTQINEKVMEWIVGHPEQLLIVLDGFDEYKDRNKLLGGLYDQFLSNLYIEMPVAALVSKLIQKKMLSESVIMVTSRPGEANKFVGKVRFDKYVDIKGFEETQILEYVEKYFSSKPKKVKEMALEKIKETAHCMAFAQVPLMCYLLCVAIEWEIQRNRTRNVNSNQFLTLTQFYLEIIQSLERNNRELRDVDEEAALSAVTKTLDSLARIAAELLEQNRFTFTLEDIKKLELPEDEIIYLKNSNLILCYPVASNSPFTKTLEYGFVHLTIQEFLSAWHYSKVNSMAAVPETSEMVYTFLSGLLGLDEKKNNDELMLEVLECVSKQVGDEKRGGVSLVRCLYEYGQEKELTRKQLTTNPDYKYWDEHGWIRLSGVTNSDCNGICMLIDESSAASQSSLPNLLYIEDSSLSCSSLNSFLPALTKPDCTIISLGLLSVQLDDKCVQCLFQYLPCTIITYLALNSNKITDIGVQHILDKFPPQLTHLMLIGNDITDNVVQHIMANFPPQLTDLTLYGNEITDIGVQHIMDNFPSQLTYLDLNSNPVSGECKKRAERFFEENYPGLNFVL